VVLVDTATYSYHAAKGHPLSSYGEDYFNCFQAAVVTYQILAYQGRLASRTVQLLGLVVYGAVVGVLINLRKLVDRKSADRVLGALMGVATCVFIAARWPQIILNCRNWGVGQLNIATTLLYFFGNCIRLYTTATQLGYDQLTMISSSFSARETPFQRSRHREHFNLCTDATVAYACMSSLAAQWFLLGKGATA
jgi:hypothetical protein